MQTWQIQSLVLFISACLPRLSVLILVLTGRWRRSCRSHNALCAPHQNGAGVARVYDWSSGRVKAQHEWTRGYDTNFSIDDLLRSHRLDVTSQQVERMAHFSGV